MSDKPHRFGWCADRKHAECRGSYVSMVDSTITRTCECECHEGSD